MPDVNWLSLTTRRKCKVCGGPHNPRWEDLKRGWGKTCSKSCAARLRERDKLKRKIKQLGG